MNRTPYETGPWSLDDLFPAATGPMVDQALATLKDSVSQVEAWRSQLGPDLSTEAFLSIVRTIDSIYRQMSRLYQVAGLSFEANTQDQAMQNILAQRQQMVANIQNRLLFFSLWWKELDDANAQRLMDEAGDFRYWLVKLRLQRPYTLSEPVEKVINIKDVNGPSALQTLYKSITNRYVFPITIAGEEKKLTEGELRSLFTSEEPDIRAEAYRVSLRAYQDDVSILGQIYQYLVRDWHSENVLLRGFTRPISVRNLVNDIPDDVVDTLLDVHKANRHLFHRFFKLKARWLGLPRLRRYDIYAPVTSTSKTVSYNDAVETVLRSFTSFDEEFAMLAQRVVDEQHIDSAIRPGKRGGAFCSTVAPDLTPWVLLSYQSRPRDVATLAHELGHALHSMLASHHSELTQSAPLPLAETASTFAEMLLIDEMILADPDPAVQQSLLFQQVDDAYATIARQAGFALFEQAAHDAIRNGASVKDLCTLYLDMLRQELGDAVDVTDEFQYEWVSIPHIYSVPFYVYAYAFGQLLVLSLYQRYRKEGDSFKPAYRAILAAGGADSPQNILEQAGVDMHAPSFWQGGFDVLRKMLDQLETLPLPT